MIYPVVELFDSIQGEGVHAGKRMFFIRLAGCNVGKYKSEGEDDPLHKLRVLHPTHSVCTTVLGQRFLCDTDYHGVEKLSEDDIVSSIGDVNTVCITGGEPYIHNLRYLFNALWASNKRIHVETSGTVPIKNLLPDWLTCSPKDGYCLFSADVDEFKFVIDRNEGHPADVVKRIEVFLDSHGSPTKTAICLSPVNGVSELDELNKRFAIEVIKLSPPHWRLTMQMHKILGVR